MLSKLYSDKSAALAALLSPFVNAPIEERYYDKFACDKMNKTKG